MKKKTQKFDITDFRRAIDEVGADPTKIAARLTCSRGTVYTYLRKYPELKAAFEARKGGQVEARKQFSKEAFEQAIKDSHGVKAAVAGAVGCSRMTVDNYLRDNPDLVEMMDSARSGLLKKAVSALVTDIDTPANDGHQRAYMFVLRTLGKDEGFSERTEVTGADGAGLLDLPPETVKLVEKMGLDLGEVAKQFSGMVKAAAAQRGIEN
jgi:AcrR family transcriptional regulator